MAIYSDNDQKPFADPALDAPAGSASADLTSVRAGGRADKRRAVTGAARAVFGREGYARASIDAIAAEAGVSTRTVYNHFEGKEQLFSTVLHASAAQVADGFVADVEYRLTGADLEGDLVALGQALAAVRTDFPEHFAMVARIEDEVSHFPAETVDAWRRAGPLRVLNEIARRLQQLAGEGLLRVADPFVAAVHFAALTTAGLTTYYGAPAPGGEGTAASVASGVEAFLHGYATPPRAP